MNPEDARNLAEAVRLMQEAVATSPNEWLPVYAAIGGAFVGAIASFIPNALTAFINHRRDSHIIEASLVAEIVALVKVVEARDYLGSLNLIITNLNSQAAGTTFGFTVDVPAHYSRIYQANCHKIGLVRKNIAVKVVRFHQLVDAVVQDVKPGGLMSQGVTVDAYRQDSEILTQAIALGRELQECT